MSKKRQVLIYFLVLTLLVVSLLPSFPVQAKIVKMGTVTSYTLTLRADADPEANVLGYLQEGDTAEIMAEKKDYRGVVWYQVKFEGEKGWVSSKYIKVTEKQVVDDTVTPDADFEAYLTAQCFPESYKESLRELHAKYPKWIFKAQHVEYTWEEAIAEENALGLNLVSQNSITSWKSTRNGAYDWLTGEWKKFDTGGWVQTSVGMIKHYMDPRNFLDEINIFQFLMQSYDAEAMTKKQIAAKKSDLTNMVAGTYLAGTYKENKKTVSYVDTIMSVAAETGVCPLTLASMMIQEQGRKGQGECISGTVKGYEGYYNHFNIGAYKTSTMTAHQRGLWYASGSGAGKTSYNRPWNTITASILGGAMYYGQNYVNVGQDTMYLKKFNVQGKNPFSHQYMTNVQGAASEGKHIADGYDEAARKAALVFKIPVYQGMPEKACERPTGNKNPNYMLKAIEIKGFNLTPTFDIYETEYAVSVPNNIENIEIMATAVAEQTKIDGLGVKPLEVGTNEFTIETTAENGKTREYKLTVIRLEVVDETKLVSASNDSCSLNEDSTITGIKKVPTAAEDFLKGFVVENGTVKLTHADGSEIAGNVGTGDQVKIFDVAGNCKYTYDVVIRGDVNGDGIINAKDLLVIQKNNIKIKALDGVHLVAADVSRDGKVNAKDLLLVQKNNIKISTIEQ